MNSVCCDQASPKTLKNLDKAIAELQAMATQIDHKLNSNCLATEAV
ncbi:MAG: hypothetical protein ACI8O8_000405, partial [Oleiphilaceae bacterium]